MRAAAGGVVVLLLIVAATAIAWQNGIWPLNQRSEAALARRAQRFWDLKISGDTLGAYNYMAEAYRRRVKPDGFARIGGGLVIHTGAKVKSVQLDDKGGIVELELRYVVNRKHFADMENTAQVKERWVFENGAWHRWPPDMG
ncbi:MAG TPA: hypothetical protein VIS07_05740 [Candidatus Binatia bacterium]